MAVQMQYHSFGPSLQRYSVTMMQDLMCPTMSHCFSVTTIGDTSGGQLLPMNDSAREG